MKFKPLSDDENESLNQITERKDGEMSRNSTPESYMSKFLRPIVDPNPINSVRPKTSDNKHSASDKDCQRIKSMRSIRQLRAASKNLKQVNSNPSTEIMSKVGHVSVKD